MKENDIPVYVNKESNHPPNVLKNIPLGINQRLCRISANEDIFKNAAPPYQAALEKSGYKHKLKFEPPPQEKTKKRFRKKEILWFNPPFSLNVKTNIGKEFLKLVDKAFPVGNSLRKIFNRSTLKIGYKCMPNMAKAISRHNSRILKPLDEGSSKSKCKCQNEGIVCPVGGECACSWVVYSAKVTETSSGQAETYTGLTKRPFKIRWKEHLRDFEKAENRTSTRLSGHIWNLKDKGLSYNLEWSFIDKAPPFNNSTKVCQLCLKEKYDIMYNSEKSSLNKRSEVFNTCRHRTQGLICNLKT